MIAQAVMAFLIITLPDGITTRVIPLTAYPSHEACMAAVAKMEKTQGTVFCTPAPKKG